MLTKTIKCAFVAGLLLASMSWHSETNYQLLLDVVVYMSAIVMVQQAVRGQEYLWAAVLAAMVLLLNPVVPVFTPAGNLISFLFLLIFSPLVIGFAALVDANSLSQRDHRAVLARKEIMTVPVYSGRGASEITMCRGIKTRTVAWAVHLRRSTG
jgi:hypothetical protein